MNYKLVGIILTAVVIATAVFLLNRPSAQPTGQEAIGPDIVDQPRASGAQTAPAPIAGIESLSGDTSSAEKESLEEKLKEEGYIQDPEEPNRMVKVEVIEGKKKVYYRDKNPETFEPTDRSTKEALETLESKKSSDPVEELRTLSRLDEKNINDAMLSGGFRDEENDIESSFSSVTGPDGEQTEKDYVCFMAPKLGMNFKTSMENYSVRADGTGYGVVRLTEKIYLRITWSFEKKRTIHGQIISLQTGTSAVTKNFTAVEVQRSRGEKMKYCN